jgi:hypothetical protein
VKSFLAALRTLVLPYGTSTGRRIILDGVNGRIEVYSASNARVAYIDDTGVWVTDPDGSYVRIYDETVGSAALIAFRTQNIAGVPTTPAYIGARVVNYSGSDVPTLDIFGPRAAPGSFSYTRYFGPDADGPYNSIINGCDFYEIYAQIYYYLSALENVDIEAPEINLTGDVAIQGDLSVELNGVQKSQGRGVVTTVSSNTTSASVTTTTTSAVLTDTTARVFETGRAYKVEIGGGFRTPSGTATYVDARFFLDNVEIAEFYRFPVAGVPVMNGNGVVYIKNETGAAVSGTPSLRIASSTAGQPVQQFGGTSRRFLKIWDVGAAADFPEAVEI